MIVAVMPASGIRGEEVSGIKREGALRICILNCRIVQFYILYYTVCNTRRFYVMWSRHSPVNWRKDAIVDHTADACPTVTHAQDTSVL